MKSLPRQNPPRSVHRSHAFILAIGLAFLASFRSGLAQESEEPLEDQEAQSGFRFVGEGGLVYQGEADIDDAGGGTVQVNRFDAGVAFQSGLTDRLSWLNVFVLGINDYNFDGGGFSAGDPWETILTSRYGTQLAYAIDDHWGVRGGGVVMLSRETDADWGDSFSGGGTAGVDYRHSDTLFVSAGLGVVSQLEDGAKVVPSLAARWLPAEKWTVRVGAVPGSGGAAAAAEVAYQLNEKLELGLGLLYRQRRFRLDDSGPAPDGVGEEKTLPLRLRVGWNFHPQIGLHFVAGVALAGELELDDQNGNSLRKEDYDPAAYLGVRVAGRF